MPNFLRSVWNKFIKGRAAAWQAICAVILSFFTFLLYRVSDRANETSRASERAFVNFAQPGVGVRLVGADGKWLGQEVALNWINSGNTPASDIVIQTNIQVWRADLPTGYAFPENKDSALAVIGPKAIYGTNGQITKADLIDAWRGKARLFSWGSVLYKDVFPDDPDRLSEFCVELTHITLGNVQPQGGTTQAFPTDPDVLQAFQWQACAEHNCYDEGCKDYSSKIKKMR